MPKPLSNVKEEDIEPQSDSAQDQAQPEKQAIVPVEEAPIDRALPEKDYVITYIDGIPVWYSEGAYFGSLFMRLMGEGLRIMGQDRSHYPKTAKSEYLRVTCEKCTQVTVSIAPHTEKFCSGCGASLPVPQSHAPVAADRGFGDDGGEVVDAEVIDEGGN